LKVLAQSASSGDRTNPDPVMMAEVREYLPILRAADLSGIYTPQLKPFTGSKVEAKVLNAQQAVLDSTAPVRDYFKNALATNQSSEEQDDSGLAIPLDKIRSQPIDQSQPIDEVKYRDPSVNFVVDDNAGHFTPEELNLLIDSYLLAHPKMDSNGKWTPEEEERIVNDLSWPPLFGELDWQLAESEAEVMSANALNAELDEFYSSNPPKKSSAPVPPAIAANQEAQISLASPSAEDDTDTLVGDSQDTQNTITIGQSPISQKRGGNWMLADSPATLQHDVGPDFVSTFDLTGWEEVLERTDEDVENEMQPRHQYLLSQDGQFGLEELLQTPKDTTPNHPSAPLDAINTANLDVANNSPSFQRMMDKLWATHDPDTTKTPEQKAAELRNFLEHGNADSVQGEAASIPKAPKHSKAVEDISKAFKGWQDERGRRRDLVGRLVAYQEPEAVENTSAVKAPDAKNTTAAAARPRGPTGKSGGSANSSKGPSKSVSPSLDVLCKLFNSFLELV
jgi:hypothetical protein